MSPPVPGKLRPHWRSGSCTCLPCLACSHLPTLWASSRTRRPCRLCPSPAAVAGPPPAAFPQSWDTSRAWPRCAPSSAAASAGECPALRCAGAWPTCCSAGALSLPLLLQAACSPHAAPCLLRTAPPPFLLPCHPATLPAPPGVASFTKLRPLKTGGPFPCRCFCFLGVCFLFRELAAPARRGGRPALPHLPGAAGRAR